jgi:hypothetical protein
MKISKLNFALIITLALGVMMVSCTGKSTPKSLHSGVEYYRNLQFSETPYDTEKGTHAITAEESKTINSYKFTYDDAGKLLSVEYGRNNVLLDGSGLRGAAKITFTYEGNKQVKHFFNTKNEQIESGGVYAHEYSLDEKGNRIGLMFLAKDGSMVENGNKIHNFKWSILPDGLVRELRYNLVGEEVVMNPFCPFYELRFTYNDKGYCTRMANYKADTLYNCTAENCGDIGVSYFTFTPNESGDVERFEVYNVTGQMSNLYWGWSKRITKFDANGYEVETEVYNQDNELVGGNQIPITANVYDEHGAVIKETNMDKNRMVINDPGSGVAVTEYKYDELGNRTETLKFDKDGAAVVTK